jgi:flagellar biogenesis protein FliO
MESTVKNLNRGIPSSVLDWWQRFWSAMPGLRVRRAPRQLRLCESVSLGEKRVVAVIQYQTQRFLIGGGAHSVSLLARLGESPDFSELLSEWCERQR